MEFDGPVSSLETIWIVMQHLLQQVISQLIHRKLRRPRQIEPGTVACLCPAGEEIDSPVSSFARCEELVQPGAVCAGGREGRKDRETERQRDGETGETGGLRDRGTKGKKSGFTPPSRLSISPSLHLSISPSPSLHPHLRDDGYTAVHLRIPLFERLSEEQIFLLEQEHHASRLEVDRLIDRLRLRLGEQGAMRVELVESRLPEKGWGQKVQSAECRMQSEKRETLSSFCTLPPALCTSPSRPLHLLPTPTEVRVMVSPSHCAEGRPVAFVHEHRVHEVTHWCGPERIAGCWWDGHDKTRDYFEVEDPTGRRFWIFRVSETAEVVFAWKL